jgi:hypothetical protein
LIAAAIVFSSVDFGVAAKRGPAFPKDRLVRALLSPRETTRQSTLDRIERQYADVPETADVLVEAIAGSKKAADPPESLLRMVRMLGRREHPEATAALVPLLQHKDLRLVTAALEALAAGRDPQALPAVARLATRPEYESSYGLRRSVFDCVTQIPHASSVDFVMRQFPKIDGLLKLELVNYLTHVTGQHFGANEKKWAQWWAANRRRVKFERAGGKEWFLSDEPKKNNKTEKVAKPEATGPSVTPVSSQTDEIDNAPTFYDFKIYAKRVIFVIDRSGSMGQRIGRESKLQQAKRELLGTIQVLPEDTSFNIMFFHGRVGIWQRGLVKASPQNKDKAAKFIAGIRFGEWTNSYGALDESLKLDGNTEAIYFLTDGEPTRGKITNVREIVRVISRENKLRRIQLNAIQIGGGSQATEFMRALAKQNEGQYRAAF